MNHSTDSQEKARPVQRSLVGYLQLAAAAFVFGLWALFLRPANADPLWAAAISWAGVGALIGPWLWLRRSTAGAGPVDHGRRDWLWIAAVALLGAGSVALYFSAIGHTTVAVAVLMHCFAPALVTVVAPFVLGTPRSPRTIALALLALAGMALVIEPWRTGTEGSSRTGVLAGAAFGAGSAVLNSGYLLLNKRLSARFGAAERLGWVALVSTPLLVLLAVIVGAAAPPLSAVLLLLPGGATIGAVGGLLFLRGLKNVPAEQAGFFMLLEPLTAITLGWLVWSERLSVLALGGMAIVFLAGTLALISPAKKASPKAP